MQKHEIEIYKSMSVLVTLTTGERIALGIDEVTETHTTFIPKSLLDKLLRNELTLQEIRSDKNNLITYENNEILAIV